LPPDVWPWSDDEPFWVDIKNGNVILVMGGNAAEAHPCVSSGSQKPKAQSESQG